MRIDLSNSIERVNIKNPLESQSVKTDNPFDQQPANQSNEQELPKDKLQQPANQSNEQELPKDKLQQAVNSINEFFEINHSELKFIFHEGLEEYFVQLVNSETEEVVREIPSKKLLDIYYEMQKLIGMMVDEKI